MLTKEQIQLVRDALRDNDDLYGATKLTALELAAAYERVAALREELHTLVHELGCDNEATQLEAERILGLLDHALEG